MKTTTNPTINNLGVSTDTDRMVYKRVADEIFDMIEFMSRNYEVGNLSKKIFNSSCKFDYVIIDKIGLNTYNVKKYNSFGNLFEFKLYADSDTNEVIYSKTKTKLTLKDNWIRHAFINLSMVNEQIYYDLAKYEMKMSKHNLDLEKLIS